MISGQAVRKFRHGQEREPRARQIAVGEKRERERERRGRGLLQTVVAVASTHACASLPCAISRPVSAHLPWCPLVVCLSSGVAGLP